MTIINEFQAGQHTEQAHAYTDLLWHLAQADKRGGSPSLASDRCASVDVLCEAHYAQLGRMPDSNVLERLASLILFDELTDTHPDKVTREDYPILSDSQLEEREKGEYLLDDVVFGRDATIGHKTTTYEDDNGVMRSARKRLYKFAR